MKKTFSLLLLSGLVLGPLSVRAQDNDHKRDRKRYENYKERSISKSYSASGNSLSIENGFGDVKIIPTSGNEIKVDIHIEASSDNKALAEDIFNGINVTDNQTGNKIKFKTDNEQKHRETKCDNCNSNMAIDYTIHMPVSVPLSIENSFGDIEVPDYSGPISLVCKFGNLSAGQLQKTDKLWIEFGSADVKSVSNVDATFKFSKISLNQLGGNNKIYMEFCGFTKFNMASDLSGLNLKESYSTVNLVPAAGLSASYSIATSFGSVVDRANIGIKRTDKADEFGPDMDRNYEGGSGNVKIEVKSSFGKVIIGEATAEEMKDKKENRGKSTHV